MLRKWGMMVLMLLAAPTLVFAQTTGKIAGVVTDADTGDPLPGASVIVVGTSLGTITDVDGNYFIIGVPVGRVLGSGFFRRLSDSLHRSEIDVSAGYTQEVDFALTPGVELDEIVVEYERPIIQKDAVGVPKIVSSEQIVNLPVTRARRTLRQDPGRRREPVKARERSISAVHAVAEVSTTTSTALKYSAAASIPQSAVQEQEMLIGSISARYGDAMSGIINITTKSGSPNFFGSFEGITSSGLDALRLQSGFIRNRWSGCLVDSSFFLSGEYTDRGDRSPRAFGQIYLPDSVLE